MRKSQKSLLYKVSLGAGAVAVVTVPTLAIVYGTKDWKYHDPRKKATTLTEKFFDDNIASSKSTYLTEKIINPSGGSDLSSAFISLDQKWMDYKHIQDMVQKDANGNNKRLGNEIVSTLKGKDDIVSRFGINPEVIDKLMAADEIIVRTADYVNSASLEKELLKINQMLNAYNIAATQANNAKRVGIYLSPDLNQRSIIIQLFELKEFADEDKNLITQFVNKVRLPQSETDPLVQNYYKTFVARLNGTKVVNGEDGNPDKEWIQMFGSEHFLEAPYHLFNWYRFTDTQSEVNKAFGIDQGESLKLVNDENPRQDEQYSKAYPTNIKMTNYDDHIYALKSFYDQHMMITHKPVVDLVSQQFKIIFTFFKFDDSSTFVDGMQQKVLNPTNIFSQTVSMPLSLFGNRTSEIEKTQANRDIFIAMTTDHSINSFQKWFDQPLTGPGLELLGTMAPSIKSPVVNMVQVFKEVDYLNKTKEDFKSKVFSEAHLNELFDRLKNNPTFDAQEFWKVCFVDFPNELMTYWSQVNELAHLNKEGMFKLYNMFAGMTEVGNWLRDVISQEYPNFELPDSDSSALSTLVFELKKNYVVPQSFSIEDILNEPKKSVITILDGLATHKLSLAPEFADIILGLLSQYVPSIKEDVQAKMQPALAEVLAKPTGIQELVKLVLGTHTSQELVDQIFSGNYLKVVEFIATNKNVNPEMIQAIAKIAEASGIIPSTFSSLLPTSQSASQMVANIFNRNGMQGIFNGVQSLLTDGIGHIQPSAIEKMITAFRDSVNQKPIVDLLGIFKTNDPMQLMTILTQLEKDAMSLANWGGFKKFLSDIEQLLNEHSTVKFGNTGKTFYEVFEHLKQLFDATTIADSESMTDALMSVMAKEANAQKIMESVLGILIYAGSDSVDKGDDQLFPMISLVLKGMLSSVDFKSGTIASMMPMALDLILHGTDYDMSKGAIFDDANPDDMTNINKFVDHVFEQAKSAGFNIDGYRKEITSPVDWLQNLFDNPGGESTVEKLVKNIHSSGNPVELVTSYITDSLVTSLVGMVLSPIQHGIISTPSATAQPLITEDAIKGILGLVKNFVPAISSLDTDEIAKVAYAALNGGLSTLPQEDWNKLITMVTGILPDSIKSIVSPELIRGVLFGFKSVDEIKTVVDKINPSIWSFDTAGINVSDIVTKIFNGNFNSDVTAVILKVLTHDLNALHPLLTKGLMGMTETEVNAAIDSLKSEFSVLNGDLGMLGVASVIVSALKDITPILKDIVPKLHAFGVELNDVVVELQKLVTHGLGSLTSDDYNKLISGVKQLIEKVKPIVPALATNDIVKKVTDVLSLLEGKGESINNLLHNGFGGTTSENIRISEVIVSILKSAVPGLPAMILDYIPKLLVGQDNIDHVRTDVSSEIDTLPIPTEVHADEGVIIPTNIGKFNDLATEVSRLANIAKDTTKSVSEILDALAQYKVQIAAVNKYNAAITKLNADFKQLKIAKDELAAEIAKWNAIQSVSLTMNAQTAAVKTMPLTIEVGQKFGLSVPMDTTKYTYTYSVVAIPTDGTYKLTINIIAKDATLVAAKLQNAQPINVNLVVTGIEAAKQAEQTKLAQLAADAANAPTFTGTAAGHKIAQVNAASFHMPTISGYTLTFVKVDTTGHADRTEGDVIFELKSTAFTSLPAQQIRVHISGFDAQLKPTPAEVVQELRDLITATSAALHGTDQTHIWNYVVNYNISGVEELFEKFKTYLRDNFPSAINEINAIVAAAPKYDFVYHADGGLMGALLKSPTANDFKSIALASTKDAASAARIKALFAALDK